MVSFQGLLITDFDYVADKRKKIRVVAYGCARNSELTYFEEVEELESQIEFETL